MMRCKTVENVFVIKNFKDFGFQKLFIKTSMHYYLIYYTFETIKHKIGIAIRKLFKRYWLDVNMK